jgi:molecular chaperone DnaK
MSIAVGIDLGSTFSVVSYAKTDGSVEVIPNSEGNRITPSVFAIDEDGQIMVGDLASEYESFNQDRVVRLVKRKMSDGFTKSYRFGDSLILSPCDISAEIIKKLKSDAENYLGESVTEAVITVPAYFNNSEREATKSAGEKAGLKVLRIINEPTAASLAYGLDKKNDSTILVYDLGGGTFDVTLLKLSDGCDFHVLSTAGDTKLGGADFDSSLGDLIVSKMNLDHCDESELRNVAEKSKKTLSQLNQCTVRLQGQTTTIQRTEFESLIDSHISKTKTCIDQAIEDANLSIKEIDEVVFVGGSTRIPYVGQKVQEWLGIRPNKSINPDEAVSIGAAIQASVLSGKSNKEVYLIDVCPLSLGIETQGGFMTVMIKRNTQIPTEHKEVFTTAFDNQKEVDVKVYQGERPQTKNNHFMGEFKLNSIPFATRGVPKINVVFEVDANGITTVKAIDESTNNEKTMVLSGKSISNEEKEKLIKDAEENKIDDERFIKINNYRTLLYDNLIQISQMKETNVLSIVQIDELNDLEYSIKHDINSDNIELLSSMYESAKDTIKEISDALYEKAQSLLSK